MDLLHAELSHELAQFPDNKFPEIDKLVVGKFDSATYVKTNQFLNLLKEYYNVKLTKANQERETMVAAMTDTPEKAAAFADMKTRFENEAVTNMVEHTTDPVRIVEWNGELLQKVYPIYNYEHASRWDRSTSDPNSIHQSSNCSEQSSIRCILTLELSGL